MGVGAARGGVGGGWEGRREGEVNKWRTLSTPMAGREGGSSAAREDCRSPLLFVQNSPTADLEGGTGKTEGGVEGVEASEKHL